MEFMEDIGVVGFEEGRMWLPTHVLDEALESKDALMPSQYQRRHCGHDASLPTVPVPRPRSKLHQKPRFHANRTSGGPGMQAIFLDSSQKSCGTGFFLPRKIGNNSQLSKKPACSSVLLPSRVVQALNLNVHALGSQLTPQQDSDVKRGFRKLNSKKTDSDDIESIPTKSSVTSHTDREDIFLPKEWSY